MGDPVRKTIQALFYVLAAGAVGGCGGGGGADLTTDVESSAQAQNRPPELASIADTGNSAVSFESRIPIYFSDPDGDLVTVSVDVRDGSVAFGQFDPDSSEIILEPRSLGSTAIDVIVSDGSLSKSRTFSFLNGDVTKSGSVSVAAIGDTAISLVNDTAGPASFVLTHNGFRTFTSTQDIVDHVTAMTPRYQGELFEVKLWRFVRDNTYHWYPLSGKNWLSNPMVLINSLGWGFCHNVAATYAELGRTAGYETRIWALNGHIVPEILIGGGWQLFDPDLSVYYLQGQKTVAGVEELASDPSLITAPVDPILANTQWAYSSDVADIYSTVADNGVYDVSFYVPPNDELSNRILLPGGARLTYQGRWTEAPTGYDDADTGPVPITVTEFEQAAMTLPPGWTGTVPLPWVAWDVLGDGQVSIDDVAYTVGSESLRQRLRETDSTISEIEILNSGAPIKIVFLVNPLRYEVRGSNTIELIGPEVWRVQIGLEVLPDENRPGQPFPQDLRRPVAAYP